MKTNAIKTNFPEDLLIDYYPSEKNSPKTVILIGGVGDNRKILGQIITAMYKINSKVNYACFSFLGTESNTPYPYSQQVKDLEAVIKYLIAENKDGELSLIATSAGAFSSVYAVCNKAFKDNIKKLVLLDPADYYLADADKTEVHSWSGADDYQPEQATLASKISEIIPQCLVDVIHLSLKNYSAQGYIDEDFQERGNSHEEGYPRLNKEMVQAFYDNLPEINKGKFSQVEGIPHGFVRDGDVEVLIAKVASLLAEHIAES